MKNFTFAKLGRALVLAFAVVIGAVCASCGQSRPAALVGQWKAADRPLVMELFRDGTGIEVDMFGRTTKIFWKVEGKRFVVERNGRIAAVDYSLSGYELMYGTFLFVRVDKWEEYVAKRDKDKVAAQKKKEEEERRRINEEESRIERLSKYFTDSRDGQKYRIVKIGDKVWMAQNLNYLPPSGNSWCYNNDDSYCAKYGRLYDWETATKVCPLGSHLPSLEEFGELKAAAGGDKAGKALKSTYGWKENGNGTDEFGFSALPGGSQEGSSFWYGGMSGKWWTSESGYIIQMMAVGDGVDRNSKNESWGYSVRCVRD
jgi:uncharacterized protein (TIGR02145 family)